MSRYERNYVQLVWRILREGSFRETRNQPTYSLFGEVLRVPTLVEDKFPLLCGRKMYPKGVIGEMAAFLAGASTVKEFEESGCNYWDQWADEDGKLEIDYGRLWRNFNGVDQIAKVIETLKTNPADRRMIVSGWDPSRLDQLSLPCCHMLYQWYVNPKTKQLDMIWYQRSVDVMIGLPSDVVLAAIWNILMAKAAGLKPGYITMMLGDTHIYADHYEAAKQYLRQAENNILIEPTYHLHSESSIDNFTPGDLRIVDYNPANPIKFEVFK